MFGQLDNSSPCDGGYELHPRDPSDLVSSGLSPYQQWARGSPYKLIGGDANLDADPDPDPDPDSIPNGIEFIFGGNPTMANDASAKLPQVSVAGTSPNRIATISFRTTAASDDLNPELQFSYDVIN